MIIQPGSTGWPTSDREYAPGRVGLDYAIGRHVVIHDWYGRIRGSLTGWKATSPTAVIIALTLPDGSSIPFSLSATRKIEVEVTP